MTMIKERATNDAEGEILMRKLLKIENIKFREEK